MVQLSDYENNQTSIVTKVIRSYSKSKFQDIIGFLNTLVSLIAVGCGISVGGRISIENQ